jgi:hypothetical protein
MLGQMCMSGKCLKLLAKNVLLAGFLSHVDPQVIGKPRASAAMSSVPKPEHTESKRIDRVRFKRSICFATEFNKGLVHQRADANLLGFKKLASTSAEDELDGSSGSDIRLIKKPGGFFSHGDMARSSSELVSEGSTVGGSGERQSTIRASSAGARGAAEVAPALPARGVWIKRAKESARRKDISV